MGKRIISQARGAGGPTYRAPSFRYEGAAAHRPWTPGSVKGTIKDILHCQGHSSPLLKIEYEDGESSLSIAPEGVKVGDQVVCGQEAPIEIGNTLILKNIPEGALIYNIEGTPGDGGKFARTSGTFARIAAKFADRVVVRLPSKKLKELSPECRATIGIIAGSGRTEKPFLKAGKKAFKMRAKNKLYPRISGGAVNAVDHPFGNKRTSRKSKARVAPRNAPPGRKVGMIRARRTGRKNK